MESLKDPCSILLNKHEHLPIKRSRFSQCTIALWWVVSPSTFNYNMVRLISTSRSSHQELVFPSDFLDSQLTPERSDSGIQGPATRKDEDSLEGTATYLGDPLEAPYLRSLNLLDPELEAKFLRNLRYFAQFLPRCVG
jgi:hypothetical protein